MNSSPTAAIRVLIVDDHPIVREGLAALLSHEPDMTVVGEVTNGREAVEEFARLKPDVLLLDLRMPEMGGVEAIEAIRRESPDARILVLTTFDGDEDIHRSLRAGAKAYLLKDAPVEELLRAIRLAHAGKTYVSGEVGARLAENVGAERLSERELSVLRLMVQGHSNREIAALLFLGESTVKSHVAAVMQKLDASDRIKAVTTALRRGLVQLD